MTKPIRGFTAAQARIPGIVATALCLMLSSPLSSRGDQVPPGCAGNGSGGNIGVLNGATHHVGDAVNFTVGIQVPAGQCQASNVTARLTFPDGTHLDYATHLTLNPGTGIACPNAADPRCAPGPYTYFIRQQDLGKQTCETNLPNVFCCSPSSANSVYAVATASGIDHTGPDGLDSSFADCRNLPITVLSGGLACFKACNNAVGESGLITFSGSVTNTGNTPLGPVTVSNFVNGGFVLVTNVANLNPGQTVAFSGSYLPANVCVPTTDTIFVSGFDALGSNVTSTCSATCSNIITPGIAVTKACPAAPVQPGGLLTFTGAVTNTGNITLTNVTVVDNQPAPNTPVFGPVTLAPGAGASFSGSYTVPADSCGPYADTVTARGATICGVNVTSTFSANCSGTNSPSIAVTKDCVGAPPQPGGTLTYQGTVTNTGNITLTNVVVVDNQPAPNTVVLGPITLAPGAGRAFTNSYAAPANQCASTDMLTATGADKCFGVSVSSSASKTCPIACAPAIQVYKQVVCLSNACEPFNPDLTTQKSALAVRVDGNCPAFCYRIVVTNIGNVTLSNVVVADSSSPGPNLNLSACFPAPFTLAPAGQPNSSATCTISSVTHCSNTVNVVTATGVGITTSGTQTVTATDTNTVTVVPISVVCNLLVSTDHGATFTHPSGCASLLLGNSYIVAIAVTNNGQYALQNVTVTNVSGFTCLPPLASVVNLGNLGIGAGAVIYCTNTCTAPGTNQYVVAVSAQASQAAQHVCAFNAQGVLIIAQSQCNTCVTCSGTPGICVTKEIACLIDTNTCGAFGKSATGFKVITATGTNLPAFCYSITVSNCGQLALTNASVIDDKFGDLTADFFSGPLDVFAVGATRSFAFKTSLEFDLTNTVNASGQSVANGQTVSAEDSATGHVFVASIACNKIVTSPDDLDGNTNDNHVLFQCGSGEHLVTYSVVVTNTGEADLTNIVINDPTLAGLCTLPGPFSLAAGASTNITLCGSIPFSCGTGGGGTNNNCGNPLLGAATGCTVLELDGHSVSITGPPGGIQGDVCIGPNGKLSITGSEYVTGNIKLSPGATYSKSGSGTIGGTVQHNVNLSSEINAALATASSAAAMPCTQTFTSLNLNNHVTNTITGIVGVNVICVTDIVLNTAVIQLSGPSGAKFIVNITGKLVLNGTSHIVAAGGVQPKDILYNIIGTGQAVAFTGGGGGVNCCASSVDGTLLAPQRQINLSPGLVNGQVISGLDISIVSGSSVRCPPGCTPVTLVNTITINAEISESQSNTNIISACVRNANGQTITTSSQCSATVECTK